MTVDERNFLRNVKEPIEMWRRLWTCKKINSRMNEFNKVKNRLQKLIDGFLINDELITIKSLLKQTESKRLEPEWGFQKEEDFIKNLI